MKTGDCLGAALLLAISCWGTPASAGNYQVHELVRSGYDQLSLRDVNNPGQMLGLATSSATYSRQVFIYSNGTFTDLPAYNEAGMYFSARSLSDSGIVVGTVYQADGAFKGAIYSNNSYQSFKPDDASDAELLGISPDGRYITGQALNRISSDTWTYVYSFVLDRSTGQLAKRDISERPFLSFRGINNAGIIATGGMEGGLYDSHKNSFQSLGEFDGRSIRPYEISDTGILAATTQKYDANMLWGSALVGQPGALERLDVPGSAFAYGVNDSGTVVGVFSPTSDMSNWFDHAFYAVTSVPEPATSALWLAGCLLVVGASTRKARRPQA